MTGAVLAGVLLGVLSRVEERVPGFSAGLSSDVAWLALAFLVGAAAGRRPAVHAAVMRGAAALTTANAGYYAWIALTEPGTALADVAGPPLVWLLLGAGGGAVFALAGRWWAVAGPGAGRLLAATPLAAVGIAEGMPALRGGPVVDAVPVLAALLLLAVSAGAARRAAAGTGVLLVASVHLLHLEVLLP